MPQIKAVTGFQQFLSSALTAVVSVSSELLKNVTTGVNANAALFSVGGSAGAVRWRDDGLNPTSNIGMRMPTGFLPYLYQGDLHKLRFIVDSVPGNADMNVTYVQVSGD